MKNIILYEKWDGVHFQDISSTDRWYIYFLKEMASSILAGNYVNGTNHFNF